MTQSELKKENELLKEAIANQAIENTKLRQEISKANESKETAWKMYHRGAEEHAETIKELDALKAKHETAKEEPKEEKETKNK